MFVIFYSLSFLSLDFHPDDLERVKIDELWLRRFIAHGEQDVATAANLLYECCQWRKEFGVNGNE